MKCALKTVRQISTLEESEQYNELLKNELIRLYMRLTEQNKYIRQLEELVELKDYQT